MSRGVEVGVEVGVSKGLVGGKEDMVVGMGVDVGRIGEVTRGLRVDIAVVEVEVGTGV